MSQVETAVDAIIQNDLQRIQALVLQGTVKPDTLEPATFEGKDGLIVKRREAGKKNGRRTLLQIAEFLNRAEIASFLRNFNENQAHEVKEEDAKK